jgi:hypothetical protein
VRPCKEREHRRRHCGRPLSMPLSRSCGAVAAPKPSLPVTTPTSKSCPSAAPQSARSRSRGHRSDGAAVTNTTRRDAAAR